MIHKFHFGKRIARYRKQQMWSQAELAEKLGVTSQAVSKWETGAALPDIDLLLELSHLYGVSINELLEDRDIIKTLAVQDYRVEGVALFDSSAELHDEWAQDMVKEGWIARSWQTAKLPEKRGEQEIGQRIAERGGLVLELGAGPGGGFIPYTLQADPDASIIVSDMSPTVVQEWKKFLDNELDSPNLSYAAFDYCQIPFRDSCIDVVSDRGGIANAITAKYEPGDKGAALKETYRVLKPGGLFVTASGFVTKETLASLPEHARETLSKERPDVFEDLYEETVLAGFREIDSIVIGYRDTDDDKSGSSPNSFSLFSSANFDLRRCH